MAAPRIPIPDLPEHTTPVDSDLLVVQNGPTTKKMTMARLSSQVTAPLDAHLSDASDAHDASAVSAIPNSAPMAGTDVQSQLSQAAGGLTTLQSNLDAANAGLDGHINDATAAHAATAVSFAPITGITSTNTQAAIAEVQAAVDDAVTDSVTALATHAADTTAVHGITDTTQLETVTGSQAKIDAHNTDTTNVHGIADAAVLETQSGAQGKVDTHKAAPNAHAAANVSFIPVGTIAATNVQDAIAEVAAEATGGGGGGTAQTIESVAGTTYTVQTGDANKIKRLAATTTITLPSSGPATGERVDFVCIGGPATFVLQAGATWDVAPTPSAVARAIGSFVTAIKMGASKWALTGDLA